jgi:RimJ/RimL family protein N-acetyltransferase
MAIRPLPQVTLRPFTDADRFIARRWHGEPHAVAWFGSRAAADAALALALDSELALCRFIETDARGIGYINAVPLEPGDAATPHVPTGSFEASLLIGSALHRGKGFGAAALAALRDEVFARTFALAVAIKVSIRNEPAVRAIEATGFRWRGIVDDRLLGRVWLLAADRPAARPWPEHA